MSDDYRVIKILIDAGANINGRNSHKLTPILHFSRQQRNWGLYRSKRIIHELIKAGADINAADPGGKTALSYAVRKKNLEFIEYLKGKGADAGK